MLLLLDTWFVYTIYIINHHIRILWLMLHLCAEFSNPSRLILTLTTHQNALPKTPFIPILSVFSIHRISTNPQTNTWRYEHPLLVYRQTQNGFSIIIISMDTDARQSGGQFPASFPDTFKNFFSMLNEEEDTDVELYSNLLEDKVYKWRPKWSQ